MDQKWVVVISVDRVVEWVFGNFKSRGLAYDWLSEKGWKQEAPIATGGIWKRKGTKESAAVFPISNP